MDSQRGAAMVERAGKRKLSILLHRVLELMHDALQHMLFRASATSDVLHNERTNRSMTQLYRVVEACHA